MVLRFNFIFLPASKEKVVLASGKVVLVFGFQFRSKRWGRGILLLLILRRDRFRDFMPFFQRSCEKLREMSDSKRFQAFSSVKGRFL